MSSTSLGPFGPTLTKLAITSITVTTTYCLHTLVSQYGWEGTFWYIWEGDPYPPMIRDDFHDLDDIEESLHKETQILDRLQETYERALLECVDDANPSTVNEVWNSILPKQNLEKLIGRINHNLDLYASKVDSIQTGKNNNSNPSKDLLRQRKKQLSNEIVQVMQRADIYVGHYQNGQSQQEKKRNSIIAWA